MQRLKRQQQLDAQSAPLRMASELGDVQQVRVLVMGATDINAGGKHGVTALHRAADRERVDVVRLLLQAGADHSRLTKRGGQTALMMAAHRGNRAICELLVQAGADVNVKNSDGWDAMMFASARRHTDVVLLLARANSSAERCSSGGVTATDLLAMWHGDTRTADRAHHATHNTGRARQQLRLWDEERARQAAQIDHTPEQPSASVGTPRTEHSPTSTAQDLAPMLSSPRDIESDARLLLAASEEQRRQQEEAQIDLLLQRSRQPITFQAGGATEGTAAPTHLVRSPTVLSDEVMMITTPPIATTSTVHSPALKAATEGLTAPVVEPVRATTTTVRDQDHAERQAERRARIEAMRQELAASLAT
jgi:hypothetical protein